jgi:hypothetical protein
VRARVRVRRWGGVVAAGGCDSVLGGGDLRGVGRAIVAVGLVEMEGVAGGVQLVVG